MGDEAHDDAGEPLVECQRVSRTFPARDRPVQALDEVSLTVAAGEVVGLLGPNGAGKSTLIRIVGTTLLPTSGRVLVCGHDVAREPAAVRPRIGTVFSGTVGLFPRLSARGNLRFFAGLYGLDRRRAAERVEALLGQFDLTEHADRVAGGLSTGLRQRLHLARALLHAPSLLLLDEPTSGLDPVAARALRRTVRGLRDEGRGLLFCTHYMYEAEEVCDRVLVVSRGRVLAGGRPRDLAARAGDLGIVEVELPLDDESAAAALRRLPGVTSAVEQVEPQVRRLVLHTDRLGELAAAARAAADAVPRAEVRTRAPTLEDVYVHLVQSAEGGAERVDEPARR
ncbi:MAG: ABC transporter ATP-binding protein [Mycobacteriales bacterium]